MYFYNFLLLISNILILTTHTQSQKGPGASSCTFFGGGVKECGLTEVSITNTPEECTAIIYAGVFVDLRYHVYADPCSCEEDASILERLDDILKSGKRTYLYYAHMSEQEWTAVLAGEDSNGGTNTLDEAKGLQAFLCEHPGITGIILYGFEYNSDTTIPFPGYSENLKKYIEVMKTSIPDLEIGIAIYGDFVIDQFTSPTLTPWLDISVIAPATDFIILDLSYFNDCSAEFSSTGIAPTTSSTTNHTLEKLKCVLEEQSFPKEKTIFKFRLNPTSDPNDSNTRCNLTMDQICLNPGETCSWCTDTQQTFNEKGKFAKEYGAGFMTTAIDLNDPCNNCKCEKPFPSFYSLLDGYNGVNTKPCNLFNRM